MRRILIVVAAVALFAGGERLALAQNGPKVHDIPAFFVKGGAGELDRQLLRHRLSMKEIEEAKLNGESTDVKDALGLMAKYEKLDMRIVEPSEVRGMIPIYLPPNTMGDEAYTTCFVAFTYNGLVLNSKRPDLELVRPETRPELARPARVWNRQHILPTRLYRLGYLKPNRIMKHYEGQIGTADGHAILQPRANVLFVVDEVAALTALQEYIDAQTLEAMGVPAAQGHAVNEEPHPPSLGAIASSETIHFYLMAFARWNRIPLFASEAKDVHDRYYREADLWTNERGYHALGGEYRRINEFVRIARDTGGEGWEDPHPECTFQPIEQRNLEIRFGVISAPPVRGAATKNKRAARKRS